MVWANLKQNLGLLNFILESCIPFAQISFIYRKAATVKPEYGLKIWNTNFCLKLSGWEYRTTFPGILFLLEVFHWNDPRDVILFHLLSNWILCNSFVNSKLSLTLGPFYSIDPCRFPLFSVLVFIFLVIMFQSERGGVKTEVIGKFNFQFPLTE